MSGNSMGKNTKMVLPLVLLLFPFIQQRAYTDHPKATAIMLITFYRYAAMLSATIAFVIYSKYKRNFKDSRYITLFLLYWLVYIFSTALNSPSYLLYVFSHAYSGMGLVLLVTIACRKWKKDFLKAASIVYSGWIYLDFFVFLLFPDGYYTTTTGHTGHVLGDDNALIFVMLPGSIIVACNSLYNYGKVTAWAWLTILVSTFCIFAVWAVSGFLTMFVFIGLLVYILVKRRLEPRLMLMGLIITIVIVLVGLNNPFISNFIENTLEKDVTLTGRTLLWAQAFVDILEKPILGYGGYFQYGEWYIYITDFNTYPCHTPYLQLLLDGGFVLFSIFFIIIISATESIRKVPTNIIGYVLCAGLMTMMFNYITEYSTLIHLYIIVTMMLNIQYLKPKHTYDMQRRIMH